MKLFGFLCVVLCATVAFGQQYAPGSTAVVNQQAVVPLPPPPMGGGLPFQSWSGGMQESWVNTTTHRIEPVQQPYYSAVQQYQPCQQYYQQPCQRSWYWYPGCNLGY